MSRSATARSSSTSWPTSLNTTSLPAARARSRTVRSRPCAGFRERDHPQAAHAGVQVSRRPHQTAASGGRVGHGALEPVLQLVDARSDLLDGGPRLGGAAPGGQERLQAPEVRRQPRGRVFEGRPFVAASLRLSNRQEQLAAARQHGVELVRAHPEGVSVAAIEDHRPGGRRRRGEAERRRGRREQAARRRPALAIRREVSAARGEAASDCFSLRRAPASWIASAVAKRIAKASASRGRSPSRARARMSSSPWQALSTRPTSTAREAPLRLCAVRKSDWSRLAGSPSPPSSASRSRLKLRDVLRHLLDEGGHQALDEGGLVHLTASFHRIIAVSLRPASLKTWAVRSACWVAARCWLDAWLMLLMA